MVNATRSSCGASKGNAKAAKKNGGEKKSPPFCRKKATQRKSNGAAKKTSTGSEKISEPVERDHKAEYGRRTTTLADKSAAVALFLDDKRAGSALSWRESRKVSRRYFSFSNGLCPLHAGPTDTSFAENGNLANLGKTDQNAARRRSCGTTTLRQKVQ